VFLQVYRSLGSLRQPAAFRSWLYRLVLRKAQRMRRQRGEEELATQPADTSSGAAAKAEHQEEIELVQRCLERLPPRQREVVVLRQLQELTYQEIAAILGIREDAARANHYQALQRLRQELRPHLP
jgi:RNA polymerase sigma-70 factor (ECF subfamily)